MGTGFAGSGTSHSFRLRASRQAGPSPFPSHPEEVKTFLNEKLPENFRQELLSLSQEKNLEMYYRGLLCLGTRLEQAEHLESAANIFHFIRVSEQTPAAISRQAEGRLATIEGRGSSGARVEFLARRLAHEATSPSAIFAMTAAAAAFRIGRLATLRHLTRTPNWTLLSRGPGLKAVSQLGGFLAESTTFTLAGKTAAAALGTKQAWDFRSLGSEWAGGALMLGGLKIVGGLSSVGVKRIPGTGALERLSRAALPQAGLLAGIRLGHYLEQGFGLRNAPLGATEWTDALASLLHFNVGGHLSRNLAGPSLLGFEKSLDIEAERPTRFQTPLLWNKALWAIGPATGLLPKVKFSQILWMTGEPPENSTAAPSIRPMTLAHRDFQFRQGSVRIEMDTQQHLLAAELKNRLKSMEDGFCSILLGYRPKTSAKLEGPVEAMLRTVPGLKDTLVRYLGKTGNQLIAQVDFDNKILRRVIALDGEQRIRMLFLQPPDSSYAVHIDLNYSRPELPFLLAHRYEFDFLGRIKVVEHALTQLHYNGLTLQESHQPQNLAALQAAPALEILLTPEGIPPAAVEHAIRLKIRRQHQAAWEVRDLGGKILFIAKAGEGEPTADWRLPPVDLPTPAVESETRPLPNPPPNYSKPPLQAPVRKQTARPRSAARPPAEPLKSPKPAKIAEIEGETTLDQALKKLGDLAHAEQHAPLKLAQIITTLGKLSRLLPGRELSSFATELTPHLGLLLQTPKEGQPLLEKLIHRLDREDVLPLAKQLGEYLAHEVPRTRALAFDLARQATQRLKQAELLALQTFLQQRYPPKSLSVNLRLLVEQIHHCISDRLSSPRSR